LLGCGEQGCTYAISAREDAVVKISAFSNAAVQKQWHAEACLATYLGSLGVAPTVQRFFSCNGKGYIVMDRIVDAKSVVSGRKMVDIREKNKRTGEKTDHISLMPVATQIGFAAKLYTLIDNGYIHMDNHIENLGFRGRDPILFDFGFTQERTWGGPLDKAWALAFSLFQIIEHCPLAEVEGTEIFRLATAIISGTYTWGSRGLSTARGLTLAQLAALRLPTTLREIKALAAKKAESAINADVYIGTMAYAALIGLEKAARYDHPLYAVIYDIRTGKRV
jgi:hypothetical protein